MICSGCTVVKSPDIAISDKNTGELVYRYTYKNYERPKVAWDKVEDSANVICKSWGYEHVNSLNNEHTKCIEELQNGGGCGTYEVLKRLPCKLSEQQRMKNEEEYRQAQIKQQQEEQDRLSRIAREYPYTAILKCGVGKDHINIAACFVGGKYSPDTQLEIKNGSDYGLYHVHELMSVGKEYRDGLHIPLRSTFEISAKNAADSPVILTLIIVKTATNEEVFKKSAAYLRRIHVEN